MTVIEAVPASPTLSHSDPCPSTPRSDASKAYVTDDELAPTLSWWTPGLGETSPTRSTRNLDEKMITTATSKKWANILESHDDSDSTDDDFKSIDSSETRDSDARSPWSLESEPKESPIHKVQSTDTASAWLAQPTVISLGEIRATVKHTFFHFSAGKTSEDDHTQNAARICRSKSAPGLMMEHPFERKLEVPRSKDHMDGTCKPCAYFWSKKDGCRWDKDCSFCHYCAPGELKKRRKAKDRQLWQEKHSARQQQRFNSQYYQTSALFYGNVRRNRWQANAIPNAGFGMLAA